MNGFYQSDRRLLATMKADDRLTITDFRVMMAAMENTKLPGDAVALGIDFLANGTRISSRAIVRSRQHLVELGYLVPCKTGQRGLSYFTVATPDAAFTDSRVTDSGVTDAAFMGTYERSVIGTHDASVIQMDTGNIETTAYTHDDEKPPSGEPTDSGKLDSTSLAQGTATPPPTPTPDSGDDGKREAPPLVPKVKPKKQYPGDLDADAEKLVDLYGELVKPKGYDNSGSRKVFLATAKRLLTEGKPLVDLERAIRNYQTARQIQERQERDPEDAKKFRFGFQTFFGPKNEHWRDFVNEMPEEPLDECTEEWLLEERRLGAELMAEEIRRRELGISDWEECPA